MDIYLYLAPFRGITHRGYREAFARHIGGFDAYYAPFISGTGSLQIHPAKLGDLAHTDDCFAHTVPQIISNDAAEIIAVGRSLHRMGYREINWNLGCPFRRIAHKKRGCGLLPYPETIGRILQTVFEVPLFSSQELQLSVKTRLGYRHAGELEKVLGVLNSYPISRIIIHPRTGLQLYKGTADPEGFRDSMKRSVHPLVYNGDIYNARRYKELKKLFPSQQQWMAGRGALSNPFLGWEIRGRQFTDKRKREMLKLFHRELWDRACSMIPDEHKRIGSMKAIWHYMAGMLQNSESVFSRIKRTGTDAGYLQAVADALSGSFADEKHLEDHFFQLTT